MPGFFRNSFCDASDMDRASHTVAATVSEEFLAFSASKGNDLRGLLSPGCNWCLCAARWKEAVDASATHPDGEKIVPRVTLEASHVAALEKGISLAELERFKVGGAADMEDKTCAPVNTLQGRQV